MDSHTPVKPKRQKRKKSRTELFSDSESEVERKSVDTQENDISIQRPQEPKSMKDADVRGAFTKYYMQRATTEFAEDLDKIRTADDFKDDALSLLISALQQGTSIFSIQEQRRIVTAGTEKEGKGARN